MTNLEIALAYLKKGICVSQLLRTLIREFLQSHICVDTESTGMKQ